MKLYGHTDILSSSAWAKFAEALTINYLLKGEGG